MAYRGTPIRLTEWTSCGGCAAKWGASLLSELVAEMPGSLDKSLLVGLAPFDDAAVYQVSPDVALVSTTDFFPPLVDDPEDFGAIAAANALPNAIDARAVIEIGNIAAGLNQVDLIALRAHIDNGGGNRAQLVFAGGGNPANLNVIINGSNAQLPSALLATDVLIDAEAVAEIGRIGAGLNAADTAALLNYLQSMPPRVAAPAFAGAVAGAGIGAVLAGAAGAGAGVVVCC